MDTQNYYSLSITELIAIENWLYEYRSSKYPHAGDFVLSKEESKGFDKITSHINNVKQAILTRIERMEDETFGSPDQF